ncbi:MAG: cysM [Gemmatimonadetes bacterium]|nr:cysM [Gemmatimonadota bacterium]
MTSLNGNAASVAALDRVAHLVGRTPHLDITDFGKNSAKVFLKLEGRNPTGSVKDRAAFAMVRAALAARHPGDPPPTLLDASSGNMACSIAYLAALAGAPATVVVSSKLTAEKRQIIEHFGATIVQVGDRTIDGNQHCQALIAQADGARFAFLDQLHNWANPGAHYLTTGPEILEASPNCAMVVASLGSGGTLSGIARYVKERRPEIVVVAVESQAGTKLPGVGGFDDGDYVTPFIAEADRQGWFDRRIKVSRDDAVRCAAVLRSRGVFAGLQTGAVTHAARLAAFDHAIDGDVVVISGDAAWKDISAQAAAPFVAAWLRE